MRLVLALDMALLLFSMLLSKSVLYLILGENETAIRAGMLYLTIRCCAMFILTPAAIYKSVLPAIGKPFFSTLSSFIEVGIRFLFPTIFATILGFASVPLTDAFTWLVLAIFLALAYHLEFQKKC
jgi:Na+-driven multidrug efflux pump